VVSGDDSFQGKDPGKAGRSGEDFSSEKMERCFNLSRSRSAFSRTLSPPPAPGAKTPKIFLLSASGNVRNLDQRHVTILYMAHPTAAPSGNTRVCRPERLPHASADPAPAPPRATHRLPRASGRRLNALSALSAHVFPKLSRPVGAHTPGPHPPHRATSCPPGVQRRPSDLLRQLQQTPDKLLTFL
jgi:hypothetical protein